MVTSLALLPDGLRFVSGSDDGTTRIAHHMGRAAPPCKVVSVAVRTTQTR